MWIVITSIIKCGMKLFIRFQTSMVAFKFGNGWAISSHTLPGMLLLIHKTFRTPICLTTDEKAATLFFLMVYWEGYNCIIYQSMMVHTLFIHFIDWQARRHQMETFSALLALCERNSPVTGEFPAQRPVTRSLDIFFDLRLNKRLSKQSWGWWFETP